MRELTHDELRELAYLIATQYDHAGVELMMQDEQDRQRERIAKQAQRARDQERLWARTRNGDYADNSPAAREARYAALRSEELSWG